MTHWFDVFRYELRQQLRRKAYLFLTFGVPVLALVAFFGYQAVTGQSKDKAAAPVTQVNQASKSIGYVDLTPGKLFPGPTSYSAVDCTLSPTEREAILSGNASLASTRSAAIKRISSPYCLNGKVTAYESVQVGEDALKNNTIDVLYVVPPDYAQTGDISVYVRNLSLEHMDTQTLMQDYLIRSVLYHVDAPAYEELYLRLRDPALVSDHLISKTGAVETENEQRNLALVYGFGLLTMLGIFWGGGYLMQSVVQEKESRIVEIVLSSVRPTALLSGKILAMGLLALLQIGMLAGTFVFILAQAGDISTQLGNIDVKPVTLVIMSVYFVLGFLLFGSLMAAIGALSTSVRESQNFVVVVTLPAALPFFFLSLFVVEPNGPLEVILSMFPLTASLSMTMRVAITHVPAGELALSLILLVLSVIGAIWLAARMFRVNTLLAGTMPRLRDVPRLILRG
jgi:ABC-2 type transport system permease protein